MNAMQLAGARAQFPLCRDYVYFNHAALSPLATPTRRAMERVLGELNESGAVAWKRWTAEVEQTRATLARLVGARPTEIALTRNTSAGLGLVAGGLAWRPGDRIVTFECEFPANLYPWLALRGDGVQVELLPAAALGDFDAIRRACRGARVLTLSFVQYLSGFRADLGAIGRICRETGTLLVVDAIQGLGAFALPVKECGIHVLAADGHKWLTGPEGAGFAFVDEAVLEQIRPREVGWLSVKAWEDYDAARRAARGEEPMLWREGAARFEAGSLNTCGVIGLGAAVELLLATGLEAISDQVLALGDQLRVGLRALGCQTAESAFGLGAGGRSGIVSFRPQGEARPQAADRIVAELERERIICASRNGWVRCSPHFYNSPEEVARVIEVLGGIL